MNIIDKKMQTYTHTHRCKHTHTYIHREVLNRLNKQPNGYTLNSQENI